MVDDRVSVSDPDLSGSARSLLCHVRPLEIALTLNLHTLSRHRSPVTTVTLACSCVKIRCALDEGREGGGGVSNILELCLNCVVLVNCGSRGFWYW